MIGCGNERHINGKSVKSAYKSVRAMKEYLPRDQKLEFQVAFWTLRNGYEDNDDFLDAVNRKTAKEIIVAGQKKFEEMRAGGFDEYQKYRDWDDMIEQDKQIRAKQDLGLDKKNQKKQRDKTNNVLYDLR